MKHLLVLLSLAMLPMFATAQNATTYLASSGSQSYARTTIAFSPSGSLTFTFTLGGGYYGTCYSGSVCAVSNGMLNATLPDGTSISLTGLAGQMDTGTVSRPGYLDATGTSTDGTEYEVHTTFTLKRNCYRTCGAPFPVFQTGSLTVITQ